MRSCQLFSMAVVALSFVGLTGCAHAGQVATDLSGAEAPIVATMRAAGNGDAVSGQGYAKRAESPIEQAMGEAAQGGYAKRAQ